MRKKLGMFALLLAGAATTMLPKPALAQDGYYGGRNQYYQRDRGWDDRHNGQWGSGYWGERDWRGRGAEERREREWRRHEWREHEWRERQRWNNEYYHGYYPGTSFYFGFGR
jgi:hypothetical protein